MAKAERQYRDLNHNGTMEPYEDPSLAVGARVEDLLSRVSLEEKAGLLFHTVITPSPGPLSEPPSAFTEELPTSVRVGERHLSHFNVSGPLGDPAALVEWHNRAQELAAGGRLGIPVTFSTDPRHHFTVNPATAWNGSAFSQWPEPIGFAAIGDEALVERFADIVRREYLATGLRVALHPQADLATEPRWARISGTFGEDARLSAKLVAAYVRGLQGPVLGPASVAAMVKHFPGGGPQRDGEDPHFEYGREQVYPGGNFDYHLAPFEAAFAAGVSQVMPYYGMPVGTGLEEVGFGYNRDVITGLLRGRYGFDGIVCTDWGLVTDSAMPGGDLPARAWGAEHLSRDERVLKILAAGADQLGGEECPDVVVHLVRSGALDEARLDVSARRVLREKFVLGLFDDPFVDPDEIAANVGTSEMCAEGLAAQRAALTLIKNETLGHRPVLPLPPSARVYVQGIDPAVANRYASLADSPADADVAVIRLEAPFEPRPGPLERFFHAGSLAYPASELASVVSLLDRAPTIVVVHLERPAVLTEIAAKALSLVGEFGASDQAVLDVVFGRDEPRGRLPFELPSSMDEVRAQLPDVPCDMAHPLYRIGHGLAYGH
jgi:beta-glucosidase